MSNNNNELIERFMKITKISNKDFAFVYLKKSNLVNNPDIVKQKINDADIIYICGGDTVKLLDHVKEYNLEDFRIEIPHLNVQKTAHYTHRKKVKND